MSFTTAIQKLGNHSLFNPKMSVSSLTALTICIACSTPGLAKNHSRDKADGQLIAGLFDKKDKSKDDKKAAGKTDKAQEKAGSDKTAGKEVAKEAAGKETTGKETTGKETAGKEQKSDTKAADTKTPDKKDAAANAKDADKKAVKADDKPKKGGLFSKKPKKEDKVAAENPKKEAEAEAKAEAEKEAAEQAKAKEEKLETKAETKPQGDAKAKSDDDRTAKEAAPAYVPDSALISVLKDLSRALSLQEELGKIEDDNQRCVVAAAREVLAKSLEDPQLHSNRILPLKDKDDAAKNITPESWASGELKVNDKFTGSLSAVWAKRINGLLNLTIAGDCRDRKAPTGGDVGQFVVIISARSPIESGFDIQTQSDVSYWFGKISGVAVESDCCQLASSDKPQEEAKAETKDSQDSEENEEAKKKSGLALQALLTPRLQKHYTELSAFEARQRMLLAKADEEAQKLAAKAEADEKKRAKEEEEEKAKLAKAQDEEKKDDDKSDDGSDDGKPGKTAKADDGKADGKSDTKADSKSDGKADAKTDGKGDGKTETAKVDASKTKAPDKTQLAVVPSAVSPPPQPAYSNSSNGWESPASQSTARQPSLTATVVMPDRAVAGHFITTSVLDGQRTAEANVELSFNGATLTTDSWGQAVFMVPEDATPGRSLHVALASRPDLNPGVIEVLQPLTIPSEHQIPRINTTSSMVSPRGTITITGHNFEGVADHNRVSIDGVYEGRAVAASPVMLKVSLPPQNLLPGPHSITVSTGGLRSNPGRFDLITTEIQTDPKEAARDNLTKLIVKVLGTTNPVQLRLTNHSPDVIKISKGNEIRVITPGGINNSVIVAVQRLRKGGYNVEATIE